MLFRALAAGLCFFLAGCDQLDNGPAAVQLPADVAALSREANDLPQPPYRSELSALILAYQVPTARLRAQVPEAFQVVSTMGLSPLVALHATYNDGTQSLGSNLRGPGYDEVVYYTLVTYRGEIGCYYLKLHVNDYTALTIGQTLYGFPKEMADISLQSRDGNLWMESRDLDRGTLLSRVVWQPIQGWLPQMYAQWGALWQRAANAWVPTSYFQREDGTLLKARMDLRPGSSNWLVSVRDVQLPYLQVAGLLQPREAQTPVGAIHFHGATLTLETPQTLP